ASGSVSLRARCLRYYASLRLPSSVPAGSLLAPDRYLGLTRLFWCSSRLAPGSARSPSASNGKRQGFGFAGHPLLRQLFPRRPEVLPSSRITPLNTCPDLRSRRCPIPLALARTGLLPSSRCNCRLWV